MPVDAEDLGLLVSGKVSGAVATTLQWESMLDKDFERLIYNLISQAEGYQNPEWLTHTNAPDRGRDMSVYRVRNDALTGSSRERVIIACKHWLSKSVGLNEVTALKEQMSLWSPPRVDMLIIATSGRFTTDCIQWVEQHNQSNDALRIEMWPESHLELLLAERPGLVAEFRLR